jgi:sugar (pentulose or hexulose) kinase
VPDIKFLTTLAGYIHWQLTGRKVLGIGDASACCHRPRHQELRHHDGRQVRTTHAPRNLPWTLADILPQVVSAGDDAGTLTDKGARRLDVSGHLKGHPRLPPEGDAGTGMVATNSVRQRTGNVSAGTSSFSMIVLEKNLSKPYESIDIVTTPTAAPWPWSTATTAPRRSTPGPTSSRSIRNSMGFEVDMNQIFTNLFKVALDGDADCGGLLS